MIITENVFIVSTQGLFKNDPLQMDRYMIK